METKLYNQEGKEIGTVVLPDRLFNVRIDKDLLHQAVVTQDANARLPLAHTKDRSEVRGGGRKPWRQKGTGRARHGSIRSPIWRGGGVTHGPRKEKVYAKKLNVKAKRKALAMALSARAKDDHIMVVDKIHLDQPKTKMLVSVLNHLTSHLKEYHHKKIKRDSVLLIQSDSDTALIRAIRNLPFAEVIRADSLNVRAVLKKKYMIIFKDAIPIMEKTYL